MSAFTGVSSTPLATKVSRLAPLSQECWIEYAIRR